MEKFKKLLMEKARKGEFLSPEEKEAKCNVLNGLKDELKGMMSDDLKRVTVASPTSEGLKAGLEKAEDVLESKMEDSEESEEMPEMSKEEKIAQLEAELAALKG